MTLPRVTRGGPTKRRRALRTASVLLACAFLCSPLATGALRPAAAQPAAAEPPAILTLTSMHPIAPQPGDTLVLAGSVTNESDSQLSNLAVELRMGGPVSARSTFDVFAAEPDGPVSALPYVLGPPAPLEDPTLAAGHSEPFRISVTLDPAASGLPTSAWQVRELGVSLTGLTEAGTESVGSLRTFLPWAPHDAVGPSRLGVAWLWPLVDRPHRGTSTVWTDDALAPELAAGGRLSSLVSAASMAAQQAPPPPPPTAHGGPHTHRATNPFAPRDVDVTWAIDPMLLDDASAMRTSCQVASGSKPVTGKGSSVARSWLAALRAATSNAEVISLPYGDPDVAAAVRNGLSTLVGVAAAAGGRLVDSLLPAAQQMHVGWPPGGVLDQRAVDALFSDGATNLVLSDAALPPVIAPNETPDARASLFTAAGDIPTALSDSILSTAVSEGATNPAQSRLDLQRFLAETLMIEAEAPSDQRSILIAPARRWTPSATYATDLLADTGKVPWLQPTTLSQILAGLPDSVQRQPLDYPASARHDELPASYIRQVGSLQHSLSQLTSILPPADAETRPFSTALLRALSSGWRGEGAARRGWISRFAASLQHTASGVRIVSAKFSTVTLTGHGGKVPVTIANSLHEAARVTVQLDAHERLALPHGGRVSVSIPAGQQTTVDVHATAKTSGVFPLSVQLLTPSGQKYGKAVQLYVRSTVYGTITLVITGAATAALLVAVAIRLTRRGIAARRAARAAAT